jgi:hypothetical protein
MKLQSLCHTPYAILFLSFATLCPADEPAAQALPAHNYPTVARVEYVNDCVTRNGGKLANLYQCSCAIDKIANALSYDEFVESSTFAKYATLPGEGGGIFRDSDTAKQTAKQFRALESDSLHSCGLTS